MNKHVPIIITAGIFVLRVIFHFATNLYQAGPLVYFFVWSMIPYSIVMVLASFLKPSIKCPVAAAIILLFDVSAFSGISGEAAFFVPLMTIIDTIILLPLGLLIGWVIEMFARRKRATS